MKTFGADKRDCCEPLESQGLKGPMKSYRNKSGACRSEPDAELQEFARTQSLLPVSTTETKAKARWGDAIGTLWKSNKAM